MHKLIICLFILSQNWFLILSKANDQYFAYENDFILAQYRDMDRHMTMRHLIFFLPEKKENVRSTVHAPPWLLYVLIVGL